MSILKGSSAYVQVDASTVIQTNTWTLNINDGIEEITDHGDSWRIRESTILDWSAVVEMFTDWTDTAQLAIKTKVLAGTSVALALMESASYKWSGTAFIDNISQDAPTPGFVRTTVNFIGSGALSYGAV